VNLLNLEPSLATVVESVRDVHAPIWQAIEDGKPITVIECAALSGAVYALLQAIDARSPKPVQPVVALRAVA
jgi:rhamnogalacturonyl hydrolase YesR